MRTHSAIALLIASLFVTACDGPKKKPVLNPSAQTEEEDSAERGSLLNAVEQHPSLQDPSQASAPVTIPTTIPPPAPDAGSMTGHEHMDDQAPADSNQQDPQNAY